MENGRNPTGSYAGLNSLQLNGIRSVIFDLDGTLVNTAPDVRIALNKTLQEYTKKQITIDGIYDLVGHGPRFLIEKAFSMVHFKYAKRDVDNAIESYLQHYKAYPVVETQIYSNVEKVLRLLKNSGIRLAICTNKPSVMTQLVLNVLELRDFFEVVISGDDVAHPKPHKKHIFDVLDVMGLSNKDAVMVGDSSVDCLAAKNANVPFIGVDYGYSHEPLESAHIISDMQDLPEKINTLAQVFYD